MKTAMLLVSSALILGGCHSRKATIEGKEATMESSIVGTKWLLTEVAGQPVTPDPDRMYLQFEDGQGRFHSKAGCNSIAGAYELPGDNHIRFSKVFSTKMACQDMTTETEFLKALASVDSYTTNGSLLSFNTPDEAGVIRLEAASE